MLFQKVDQSYETILNLSEDEFELFEHAQHEYSLINSKKFADRKH